MIMLSYDPSTKLQYGNRYDFVDKEVFPIEEGCEVEYIRTDAFIEKACEFLKSYHQETYDGMGYIAGIVNDKTIEDFRNYMKGK